MLDYHHLFHRPILKDFVCPLKDPLPFPRLTVRRVRVVAVRVVVQSSMPNADRYQSGEFFSSGIIP